jgi:hypothetical protein
MFGDFNDDYKAFVKQSLGYITFLTILLAITSRSEDAGQGPSLFMLYLILGALALNWIICKIKRTIERFKS